MPRESTEQQQVLVPLRRPEDATAAQMAEAAGWRPHTFRGLLAVLKRHGMDDNVLERVRQVGPDKQGAQGSYAVCGIAEAA